MAAIYFGISSDDRLADSLSLGPKTTAKLLLLDNSFAAPHPPIECFVANKGQTAIRQDSQKAVEGPFSLRFGLESRSFFLVQLKREFYFLVNTAQGLNAER
jgi:hypothetical protein